MEHSEQKYNQIIKLSSQRMSNRENGRYSLAQYNNKNV